MAAFQRFITSEKTGKISFRNFIFMLLIVCCYICFTYYSLIAFVEFRERKTGINHVTTLVTEIELPTITICPKESYKHVDNQTNKDDFLKNLSHHIYSWKDFFPSEF